MSSRVKSVGDSGVRKRRRVCYEPLEPRHMMAGDVAVQNASSGILQVTGDNAGNQIVVSRQASSVIVQGLNGTTVNGQARVVFSNLGNALNGLDVNLNGGDDSLFLDDLLIRQSAVIRGGLGSDAIILDDVSVGRDLTISGGDGENAVSLDDVVVNRNLTVLGGTGNDVVGLDGVRVQGATNVRLGAGNDRLAVEDSVHRGQVSLSTEGGADFIGLDNMRISGGTRINMGAGNDFRTIEQQHLLCNGIVLKLKDLEAAFPQPRKQLLLVAHDPATGAGNVDAAMAVEITVLNGG